MKRKNRGSLDPHLGLLFWWRGGTDAGDVTKRGESCEKDSRRDAMLVVGNPLQSSKNQSINWTTCWVMRYWLVESATAHPRLVQELFNESVSRSSSQSRNWSDSEDAWNDGKEVSAETAEHFLKTMRVVPPVYNGTHGLSNATRIVRGCRMLWNAMFGGEEGAAEGDREDTRPSLVCHPDVSHRELLKERLNCVKNFKFCWHGSSKATSNTNFRQSRDSLRLSLPARQEAKQR